MSSADRLAEPRSDACSSAELPPKPAWFRVRPVEDQRWCNSVVSVVFPASAKTITSSISRSIRMAIAGSERVGSPSKSRSYGCARKARDFPADGGAALGVLRNFRWRTGSICKRTSTWKWRRIRSESRLRGSILTLTMRPVRYGRSESLFGARSHRARVASNCSIQNLSCVSACRTRVRTASGFIGNARMKS